MVGACVRAVCALRARAARVAARGRVSSAAARIEGNAWW